MELHMAMRSRVFGAVSTAVIVFIVIAAFTSCGFGPMFYDMIFGGEGDEIQTYALEVTVRYNGYHTINSYYPLYIAAFGLYFEGEEPDLVFLSSPIVSNIGSYTFTGLEELAYGVIVFIDDFYNDEYPTEGEVYQFYDMKDQYEGPDEIYLDQDMSVNISLNDDFSWYDTGGGKIAD